MQPPRRLKGMQDLDPLAAQATAWAADSFYAFLDRYGYRRVDTPLLEETDLLLRKSGGELASRMYTFTDPGGHRVSLRPEFTSSVVRAYLQGMHGAEPLPVRWSYLGPVFRYDPEEAEHRQFTQAGAELLGAAGPAADAEVMAVATKGLSHLGVRGHRLVVGHLGFISALLDSQGLSDRARIFLAANVGSLSRGPEGVRQVRQRANELELFGERPTSPGEDSLATSDVALALLEQYVQASAPSIIGTRTPQDIRERFLRKQQFGQENGRFEPALDLLSKVVRTRGQPRQVLPRLRRTAETPQAKEALDQWEEALDLFSCYDTGVPVTIDLGLARGIAYYTGIVFDIQHPAARDASLGGGGRYDGLIQALGGDEPTPALGFAYNLERVLAVLAKASLPRGAKVPHQSLLVRPAGPAAMAAAAREAERLRSQGNTVRSELQGRPLKASLLQAQAQGMGYVITVDADGKTRRRKTPIKGRPGIE